MNCNITKVIEEPSLINPGDVVELIYCTEHKVVLCVGSQNFPCEDEHDYEVECLEAQYEAEYLEAQTDEL